MLLVFQSLPASSHYGEEIKSFVYDWANFSAFTSSASKPEESAETVALTQHLDELVARFFTGAHTGSITLFSVLLVIWAALALLSTIERSFNNIWHVGRGRSFLHRIINYWAVLTLGPLLVGAGIYVSTRYLYFTQIQRAVLSGTQTILANAAPVVLYYVVATVVFFLLYFVLPNTKVQARAAIWGALVAALVWIAAKNIYGYCVMELKLYSTVYGVLALVPITVLWIYITWLIVLFGLQLTFTTQHLRSLDAAEIAAAGKREEFFIANDLTVINIVREIAAAFEHNRAPVSGGVVCSKLNIPAEFGDKILSHLVDSGLIAKTSDPRVGFTPVRDPASIKLSDISAIVAEVGLAQSTTERPQTLEQIAQSQRDAMAQYSLRQVL
jgi:membrane protein